MNTIDRDASADTDPDSSPQGVVVADPALTGEVAAEALRNVRYPGLDRDIVSLGLVRAVTVRDGRVHVSLALSTNRPDIPDLLRSSIRDELAAAGALRSEVQILPPAQITRRRNPWADRQPLPGVRCVIAVGAGKGGVGKSTVAVNLALALATRGTAAGVLDADIYGPSVPTLLGLEDGAKRIEMTAQRQIRPLRVHGLAVVSFGFFLGPESPAVWRGPMVGKAVKQFSRGVLWPRLDVLVVDLPPGTGDVPLSLAQAIAVHGAIVVTTPQRLAALEAAKAIEMFTRLSIPVVGVVENMSHAGCACGRRSYPFGRGGGAHIAKAAGAPLLAAVPFEEANVTGGDTGAPAVIAHPAGETARAFAAIAQHVVEIIVSAEATS